MSKVDQYLKRGLMVMGINKPKKKQKAQNDNVEEMSKDPGTNNPGTSEANWETDSEGNN